jgi:hypothetical protein
MINYRKDKEFKQMDIGQTIELSITNGISAKKNKRLLFIVQFTRNKDTRKGKLLSIWVTDLSNF